MSLNQFLRKLSQTEREWQLIYGQIRAKRPGNARSRKRWPYDCPISAAGGTFRAPITSGIKLGLKPAVAVTIVKASDWTLSQPSRDPGIIQMRTKLLKALNLKERT